MLRAILNKSWRQHPTKQQLYGHLPPITKSIEIRRTRYARHSWKSRDELISDVLLWTPSHGRAKLTSSNLHTAVLVCNPEDLPEAMDDREGWRDRVWETCADSATWWWWQRIITVSFLTRNDIICLVPSQIDLSRIICIRNNWANYEKLNSLRFFKILNSTNKTINNF